ncbi:hypothetical protein [Shewanella baltica]|jgi:hypothetical protein|uniref:Uncharacterized protein n=1 Tax=Shewanella baltica (strain OS195) TaxID=399599 RepID=A9L6L1_SHEB9|nr:hypothetical protein [Shewanella baltica]ABS10501.1 conserved hypothetical protein [Shewanella baltica OS185]ABX51793.1 conserved hypothetical protein [Shewanella baltica OS195]ACK48915.1 conserved hypothetical protein [Shewanella baltica OS223]
MSSIEIDDIKIKYSPLNKELVVDGELLSIFIYEGDSSGRWVLEVVDECGTSTVWDYQFESDQAAFDEALNTINEEGIKAFKIQPEENLH